MNKINFELTEFFSDAENAVVSEKAKSLIINISKTDVYDKSAIEIIFSQLKGDSSLSQFVYLLLFALSIFIIIKLFCSSFNTSYSIKYCTKVIVSISIIHPIYKILTASIDYMRDLSLFLGILAPTTGIITAAGGNMQAAAVHGWSFSLILVICQILLNILLPVVSSFFIGIAIVDVFSDDKKMTSLSQFVRNSFFVFFSVSVSLIFIIINFYNNAATAGDTLSSKAIRLLISNSVPLIGGTIGEAIKLFSVSIVSAKSVLGLSSILFVLALFLPYLIFLFAYSILLNFFGMLCDYFEVTELKGTLMHLKYGIDFVLASFSAIIIICFINIGVFMNTVPLTF